MTKRRQAGSDKWEWVALRSQVEVQEFKTQFCFPSFQDSKPNQHSATAPEMHARTTPKPAEASIEEPRTEEGT